MFLITIDIFREDENLIKLIVRVWMAGFAVNDTPLVSTTCMYSSSRRAYLFILLLNIIII